MKNQISDKRLKTKMRDSKKPRIDKRTYIPGDDFVHPTTFVDKIKKAERHSRCSLDVDQLTTIFKKCMEPQSNTTLTETNDIVDILEDTFLLFTVFYRTRDFAVLVSTTLLFLKKRMDNTLYGIVSDYLSNSVCPTSFLEDDDFTCFDEFFSGDSSVSSNEPQSNICDGIRKLRSFKNTTLFKNLHKVMTLVVTFGLLDPIRFTIKGLELFTVKSLDTESEHTDFFDYALSTIEYFVKMCTNLFSGESVDLFSLDELGKIDDDIIHLSSNIDVVCRGGYEKLTGKSNSSYHALLADTMVTLRYLMNNTSNKHYRLALMQKLTMVSKLMVKYQTAKPLQGMRKAPFGICVYGPSSVGKSTIVNLIMATVLKANGYDHTDKNMCTLQPNDKFYSTYRADTTAVLIDDAANTRAEVAEVNPADMIISLVNNVQYYAPKAIAEEKGSIKVEPAVVAITTNDQKLQSDYWSTLPISVMRRLVVHIEVSVKDGYSSEGFLEHDKIPQDWLEEGKSPIMDLWNIKVYRIKQTSTNGQYTHEVCLRSHNGSEYVSIHELLNFLISKSRDHFKIQEDVVARNSNVGDRITICECCSRVDCQKVCTVGEPILELLDNQSNYVECVWLDILRKWLKRSFLNRFLWAPLGFKSDVSAYQALFEENAVPLLLEAYETHAYHFLSNLPHFQLEKYIIDSNVIDLNLFCLACLFLKFVSLAFGILYLVLRCWTTLSILVLIYYLFHIFSVRLIIGALRLKILTCPVRCFDCVKSLQYYVDRSKPYLRGGLTISACLYLINLLRKFYNGVRREPHGNLCPLNEAEILQRDSEVNPWVKRATPFIYSDVTATSTSEQLCNKISKNCLYMRLVDDNVGNDVSCLVLRPSVVMCPYHFFFKGANIRGSRMVGTRDSNSKSGPYITVEFTRSENRAYVSSTRIYLDDIIQIGVHDMCIFQTYNIGTHSNIIPLISTTRGYNGLARFVRRRGDGSVHIGTADATAGNYEYRPQGSLLRTISGIGGNVIYNFKTERGMCTGVLVTDSKKPTIFGFHIAGVTGTERGVYVSPLRSEIEQSVGLLLASSGNMELHTTGVFNVSRFGVDMNVREDIHPGSPVNFIEEHTFGIRGSIGTSSSYYSEIRPSLISATVTDVMGEPNLWKGPKFGPEKWKPWYDFLSIAAEHNVNISPQLLHRAKRDYLGGLYSFLTLVQDSTRPLTDDEVVNGIHGKRFVDAMNFQSSAGFPLRGPKSHFVDGPPGYKKFTSELDVDSEIERMNRAYLSNQRYYCIFKSCLKDEATLKTKDKVRVFQAADLALQLQWRKYGLPILRFLSLYPLASECAVGLNPFGEDWDTMHRHVTFNGEADDYIVAGDYSKWDIRLPPDLIAMAFQIIIDLASRCRAYTDEDIKIMRGLATDTIFYVTHFNGTLLEMCGGVPSGHNLTAHINSICNSLLIRCAFFDLGNGGKFRHAIHIMTYGDDFYGGKGKLGVVFDNILYATWLQDKKITLTMPDKKAKFEPYLNIFQCDFLKRRSVLCDKDNRFYGALDISSLLKSLHNRGKIAITERAHAHAVLEMFQREISYHPRDTYDYYMAHIREICMRHEIVLYCMSYDYDEYYMYRNHLDIEENISASAIFESTDYPMAQEAVDCELTNSHHSVPSSDNTYRYEFDAETCVTELETIFDNNEVERISTVPDLLKDSENEPQSNFGGEVENTTSAPIETGTLLMTPGRDTNTTMLEPKEQKMLALRQDESRSLGNYLSRPEMIYRQPVSVGAWALTIYPLLDYLSHPNIREKIRGYAYMNAMIHIKIDVVSNPQNSGACYAGLHPWWTADTGLGRFGDLTAPTLLNPTQISCLPHVLLDYGIEKGGQISMPIIAPTNGLLISDTDVIRSAFALHFSSVALLSKPVTSFADPVITVYVWLTDVSLTGTTYISELPVTQGNEYDKKPKDAVHTASVSLKDSAKLAARQLTGLATDMGVDAMFSVVGLNTPNDPTGPLPMVPRCATNMSCVNGNVNIDNLAADCKNEVTQDLANIGYDVPDPMALDNIYTRWAYVDSYRYPTGRVTTQYPFMLIPVSPAGCYTYNQGGVATFYPTPLAIGTLGFSKWRGTLRYKFYAVGSAFLRGKLKISHDVNGVSGYISVLGEENSNLSRLNNVVWDLAETRCIEVEVPWTSNLPFKDIELLHSFATFLDAGTAGSPQLGNGTLIVTPFVTLSDGSLPNVTILAYVSGKSGMALGDLRPVLANYTFAGINNGQNLPEPQSNIWNKRPEVVLKEQGVDIPSGIAWSETQEPFCTVFNEITIEYVRKWYRTRFDLERLASLPETQSFIYDANMNANILSGDTGDSCIKLNLTGMEDDLEDSDAMVAACLGEKFFNLRQLIKRYTMNFTRHYEFIGTNDMQRITMPDRPLLKGWQGSASLQTDPGGKRATYARDSFLSFYSCCFLGYRGSFRHKIEVNSPNVDVMIHVVRARGDYSELREPTHSVLPNNAASFIQRSPDFRSGGLIGHTRVNGVVEYSTPFQSRAKFMWAQDRTPQIARSTLDGAFDRSAHQVALYVQGNTNRRVRLNKYIAAGDDFTFIFFLYPPTMVAQNPGAYPQV